MKIISCRNFVVTPYTIISPCDYATHLCGKITLINDITGSFNDDSDSFVIDPNHPTYTKGDNKTEFDVLRKVIKDLPTDKPMYVLWSGGVHSTYLLTALLDYGYTPKVLYFPSSKYENPEYFDYLQYEDENKKATECIEIDPWNIREELNKYAKDNYVLTGFNGCSYNMIGSTHGIGFLMNPTASLEDSIERDMKRNRMPNLYEDLVINAFHNLKDAFKIPFELNALQYYRLLTMSCLWRYYDNIPKLSCDYPNNIINPFSDYRFMTWCINHIGEFTNDYDPKDSFNKTWVVKDKHPTGDVLTDEGNIHFDLSEGIDTSVSTVVSFILMSNKYNIPMPKIK